MSYETYLGFVHISGRVHDSGLWRTFLFLGFYTCWHSLRQDFHCDVCVFVYFYNATIGGVVFLYRGRHYDPRTRARYPLMLWKPATPVYPKLIKEAPEGLTKEEADEMRRKGHDLLP